MKLQPWSFSPGTIAVVHTEVQPVPGYFVTLTQYEAHYPGFPAVRFFDYAAAEKWLIDTKELIASFRYVEMLALDSALTIAVLP